MNNFLLVFRKKDFIENLKFDKYINSSNRIKILEQFYCVQKTRLKCQVSIYFLITTKNKINFVIKISVFHYFFILLVIMFYFRSPENF